jgi:transposase
MSNGVTEITAQEIDALIERMESVLAYGLSPEPADLRLILQILRQFTTMQGKLEGSAYLKNRYLKLMGLLPSSETQQSLGTTNDQSKPKPGKPRKKKLRPASKQLAPTICHHRIEGLKKGQICPECEKGRLYKYEPASFIRIVGQPPLSCEKHILEQLRCNLCGELFSAELPDEVAKDGVRSQQYTFSARAMMAINKFYMGSPYYRQESLQALLGRPVTASTIYDQCALLVSHVSPVWEVLKQQSANAWHFHIDDTGNRILSETVVEKPNRHGKGTRQRSGIYSSCLIATLSADAQGQQWQAVLFNTNIGHSGEWIDEILAGRDSELPLPTVMGDALASNKPLLPCNLCLCNSHGRRKFVDVMSNFREEVAYVVACYAAIWANDDIAREENLNAQQRLAYHKEHSLPVMEHLQGWCEAALQEDVVEENSGLGKALRYYLKHYEGLTAFCRIEGARLDNNLAEQLIKIIARCRKNSLFYKTQAGADVGDVITSLIATCELNGVNGFEYLVALQQHRRAMEKAPERWLPWNYQAALAELEAEADTMAA